MVGKTAEMSVDWKAGKLVYCSVAPMVVLLAAGMADWMAKQSVDM